VGFVVPVLVSRSGAVIRLWHLETTVSPMALQVADQRDQQTVVLGLVEPCEFCHNVEVQIEEVLIIDP
jgi:hypothetical protein